MTKRETQSLWPYDANEIDDMLRDVLLNDVAARRAYESAAAFGLSTEMQLKATVIHLARHHKRVDAESRRSPMSAEELKQAMDKHISVLPQDLSQASLRAAGCLERVSVLPVAFDDRIRYVGNLLVQMVLNAKIDSRLKGVVSMLCQSLSYLLNSTSWKNGEVTDFDMDEVRRKVGRLGRPSDGD